MHIADNQTIIQQMQHAVDVVMHSEHGTSKVAACLFDASGVYYASANYRPAPFKSVFAWDKRLGMSSQFIHAEVGCLIGFNGVLQGASLCITDPFCPNCAKLVAEAGIKNVYIDHKGFEKDFISRNAGEFKDMSMSIAKKAGMNVYEVNRKAGVITPILHQGLDTQAGPRGYEWFEIAEGQSLQDAASALRARLGTQEAWVMAFVRDVDGKRRGLIMFEALPPGFTPQDYVQKIAPDGVVQTSKYRYPTDPLIRLLIATRRMGLHIEAGRVVSAEIPSSRALVNAVGFGLEGVILASDIVDRDESAREALQDLQANTILDVLLL